MNLNKACRTCGLIKETNSWIPASAGMTSKKCAPSLRGEAQRRCGNLVRMMKRTLVTRSTTLIATVAFMLIATTTHAATITIGSKSFTENYLLAEIFAQWIEGNTDHTVQRRFGLDTKICFDALSNGDIDLYPEYTGTIKEVLLKDSRANSAKQINDALGERFNLVAGPSLGFNNTYVLAIHEKYGDTVRTISDLQQHPKLSFGFSHQFLERSDGWPELSKAYKLQHTNVRGVKHALAYDAIVSEDFDITDAYSTDGKLDRYPLILLEDDRQFFPEYLAIPLLTKHAHTNIPELMPFFATLAGILNEDIMRTLNARAETQGSYQAVAQSFLLEHQLIGSSNVSNPLYAELWRLTVQHVKLTGTAVFFALLIGIPLGIVCTRVRWLASIILSIVGLLQTIPSIALLAFMIPLLGIGTVPAITALFLYGLLPIVRNTYTGIREVSPILTQVADGIGLSPMQRLLKVELPLALPFIVAGIKICTVVSIGTATLAAFIGAGGYGEPIVTGLAMNDSTMILRGAIPAALMAIAAEYGWRILEHRIVSPGLTMKHAA